MTANMDTKDTYVLDGQGDSTDLSDQEIFERKSLVLWRLPLKTLRYGGLEAGQMLISLAKKLKNLWLLGSLLVLVILCLLPGPHANFVRFCQHNLGFALFWLGLGVLSSVGFGTGLHTFLLYLGPHIASVTMAAYECQTLNFPTPPYPDTKICPPEPYTHYIPDIWAIMAKVRPEALFWGFGTAVGELPPYFMARTARLSGQELEGMTMDAKRLAGHFNILDRTKMFMERVMERVGFVGILLCASVPNPLFDLAGITCGHFLVPFWKFFVATIIGKTFIKATLQLMFVIVVFSEDLVGKLVACMGQLPLLGPPFEALIRGILGSAKQQMHKSGKSDSIISLDLVVRAFELCAFIMVGAFVVSALNSLAQIHCKRRQEKMRRMRSLEMILYVGGGRVDSDESSLEEFTV
ncbi:hypothetical protein KR009_000011 [Drosophila setifemur]|nr:hypothetical protein KR009_000011 [Drosophila setifemur]